MLLWTIQPVFYIEYVNFIQSYKLQNWLRLFVLYDLPYKSKIESLNAYIFTVFEIRI